MRKRTFADEKLKEMITFPNAKINVGLHVVERRPDGYHNIETLFYPISLADVLEIVPATATTLSVTGFVPEGDVSNNLVMRAYRLLQERYDLPAVEIHLHKAIPFGAGLGGGSSDAAYALRMLRDMFQLPISDDDLAHMAASLGADCPFFIYNRPLLATGIGDCFESTDFTLQGKYIVLVKPPVEVSTAEAYARIVPAMPQRHLCEKLRQPLASWRGEVVNDFEPGVFMLHPRIAAVKQRLYEMGATYASMSGSGASVFGIFDEPCNYLHAFPDCFVWSAKCEV